MKKFMSITIAITLLLSLFANNTLAEAARKNTKNTKDRVVQVAPAPIEEPKQPEPIEEPKQPEPIEEPKQPEPIEEPKQPEPIEEPKQPEPVLIPIMKDDFESGKISSVWNKEFSNKAHSANVVSNDFSKGKYSLRMELLKTDSDIHGSKRSEIALNPEGQLEEHWYHVSIYLPNSDGEDFALDKKSGESLMQWHNTPDEGEAWTCPPLALITQNGNYYINRFWDDAEKTTTEQMFAKGNFSSHNLGSYNSDKGRWVDWKFHVKWGWHESQKPILEVYKDGVMVLNCNGKPNTTNDIRGVYWKLGIYKWDWKENPSLSSIDKRVVYYDNVIMMQANR